MNWLVKRLREASTWRGLVWLATVAGLSLRPEQAEAIVTVGMAIAGLLGVFLSDEPTNVHIELPPVELVGSPQMTPISTDANSSEGGNSELPQDVNRRESAKSADPRSAADRRSVVLRPAADRLRQSVPAPSRRDENPYPDRFESGGWGDK